MNATATPDAGSEAGTGGEPEQEETAMIERTEYLNTREAAAHLGLSTRTLDRYRVSGDGPVFLKFGGRVRYLREDLDDWACSRRRRSTSDDGTGPRPEPAGADR